MEFPKPEPKKKGTKARLDKKHADKVRQRVMDRDGGCRYPAKFMEAAHGELGSRFFMCDGPLEWAHLPEWRRSRTMGQAPEDRHTMEGSMMLCRRHHTMLDHGELEIHTYEHGGANGRIRWYLVLGES